MVLRDEYLRTSPSQMAQRASCVYLNEVAKQQQKTMHSIYLSHTLPKRLNYLFFRYFIVERVPYHVVLVRWNTVD